MKEIYYNTVQEFNDYNGFDTLHPLVSVARFDQERTLEESVYHYGLYALFLKENKGCKLSYGRTEYDFDEMTVTSFAPGQQIHVEPNPDVVYPKWTALVFHPDLLNRTQLGRNIGRYEFFDYTSNEALHLSCGEIAIFRGVLDMIQQELHRSIDKHSRELIVSNIELLLNESTEKVGRGAILPFFLLITYGHSQLSTIGGECFFVADGVQAFRGEALVQVADFWWFY